MVRVKLISLFVLIFCIPKCINAQTQFKKLERNWDNLLPIFPEVLLESEDHYIIMSQTSSNNIWQVLALDSNGNYSYKNFPKINTFNSSTNILFYNHNICIPDLYNINTLDSLGNVIQQIHIYGDSINGSTNGAILQAFFDSTTVICSGLIRRKDTSTFANPMFFKLNNDSMQWAKVILGTTEKNVIKQILQGFIGSDGYLYSIFSEDSISSIVNYKNYQVLKTDTSNGNLIWAKKYFESPYYIKDILPYDATSFLLYGNNSNDENGPYYDDTLIVARVDTSGAVLWCRKYKTATGVFPLRSSFTNIINTKDGGFLLAAPEWQYQGQTNTGGSLAMVKFDSQFNIQWGRSHYYGNPRTVIQTSDRGYLVAGDAAAVSGPGVNFYSYIIKTDSLGLSGCYEDTLTGVTYTTMSVTPVTMNYTTDTVSIYTMPTTAGDTMLGTYSEYDACIFLGVEQTVKVKNNSSLLVYPNPATSVINLVLPPNQTAKQIELYDMQGRLVLQSKEVNQYPLQLNVATLTKGIYQLRVLCGANTFMAKIVVE